MRRNEDEMDNQKLADLLFPEVVNTPEYYEEKFPYRKLPNKAEVTRMAPSPTGFIHLGNLYSALADERIAHRNGGVFYLRIEDTDEKRKVDGAVETIINVLRYFDIEFDEGAGFDDTDPRNAYGPYFQRQRVEIYHTYAKSLVERGLAYPCFCTEEELDKVRAKQEEDKVLTGYYGEYATCRNLSYEEIEANIKAGKPYVLRLRSQGSPDKEITFVDAIKGEIKLPENIHDIVLLKKDGIPTYHFAHAIDDHLMRTTTVVRGGEWLASAPIHYELFHLLGFKMPAYAHTAHLMKFDEETGGKRKLSKRKDPELSLDYYRKDGYHPYTMKVYLLTLLNSNFEEWHEKFPDKDINEFPFSVEKMNQSGALFDKDKLHNICKNELSKLSEEELYDFLYDWAKENEPENVEKWFGDREKMLQILRLYMGVGAKRRRKDLMYAKQIFELISFFFDGESGERDEFRLADDEVKVILNDYLAAYDHNDDNSVWFNKLKEIADEHGFASDMKAYKANPENFKGNVSDIAEAVRIAVTEVVRIAVTGRANTPDLWTIVHIMGEEQMKERISRFL
jgi:glutamyl-tRNA synthetase